MALQKFITGAFLLAMVSSASAATPTPTTTGPTTTGITTGGGTVTTSTSTGTCPSPYTVTAGDNCWKVAVDHQVSPWWEIYWFNTALCAPSNAMNLQPSDVLCLTGTPQNAPPTAYRRKEEAERGYESTIGNRGMELLIRRSLAAQPTGTS
ncbi:hypothetical protein HK104_003448 [Borealophlyctis nickersoniae]|nr:hypothetical protein HK104_003448 [Borealophlyctis nickersoniae]